METSPETAGQALLSLGWSGCDWASLTLAMPEMHSQSSGNAVGSWECAHHEEGGFETVARVCFFLKVLKRGWGEQRKNTVFS